MIAPVVRTGRSAAREGGFSLLETLVALFLIGLGALSAAPLFVYASEGNRIGAAFSQVGARAVARMELLRAIDYSEPAMAPGGSLTSNVSGGGVDYFDADDPDYLVRWSITAHPTIPLARVVRVEAVAVQPTVGAAKRVALVAVRGE